MNNDDELLCDILDLIDTFCLVISLAQVLSFPFIQFVFLTKGRGTNLEIL